MIGKIMKNSSFRCTTEYLFSKDGARQIGGNMVGRSVGELVAEFMMSRDLNPQIKRPVYHVSLSLPHQETLDENRFSELAERYLEGMGFDTAAHQYMVVRHSNRTHDHIHIVASRINLHSGKVLPDSFDRYRSQTVIRQLESEYELTAVPSSWEVGKRSESKGQLEMFAEAGIVSVQVRLQRAIDEAAASSQTASELVGLLMEQGISVIIGRSLDGGNGISYQLDGVAMAGSDLGNRYSLPGLEARGIEYQPHRDAPEISRQREQARLIQAIAPGAIKTWAILNHLKASLVDGKTYRLAIKQLKEGSEFSIYRKLPYPQKVLTLRQSGALQTKTVQFSLKDSNIEQQDCDTFDRAKVNIDQWQKQLVQAQSVNARKQVVEQLSQL